MTVTRRFLSVEVVARAREVSEAVEPHDEAWAGFELLDDAEQGCLRITREVRLVEDKIDIDCLHGFPFVAVAPEAGQAALPPKAVSFCAFGPIHVRNTPGAGAP